MKDQDQLLDLQTTDSFRLYLDEVGRHPLLTKDDEIELSQAYEAGLEAQLKLADTDPDDPARPDLEAVADHGEWARRKMIESNLRLVVSIARRFSATGLPLGDLVQEGNLGLLRAVEKFDWRKGFKFSTYATWWIRQAIQRGIANTGRTIRLPAHAGDSLLRLHKVRAQLEAELERDPTIAELANELDLPAEKVKELLLVAPDPVSLAEPVSEDGETELGDLVQDQNAESPFDAAARAMLPAEIDKLLAILDERERSILSLRFGLDRGEPRTPDEVGELVNLSRERVRQIEARALSRLRHPSADRGMRWLLAS
jgi:RNA polymerase sigma factor (sigma-70 family)